MYHGFMGPLQAISVPSLKVNKEGTSKSTDCHTTWSNDLLNLDKGHINLFCKFSNSFIRVFIGWRINVILHSKSCSGGDSPKHHQNQILRDMGVNKSWKETVPFMCCSRTLTSCADILLQAVCVWSLSPFTAGHKGKESQNTHKSLSECWGRILNARLRESLNLGIEDGC